MPGQFQLLYSAVATVAPILCSSGFILAVQVSSEFQLETRRQQLVSWGVNLVLLSAQRCGTEKRRQLLLSYGGFKEEEAYIGGHGRGERKMRTSQKGTQQEMKKEKQFSNSLSSKPGASKVLKASLCEELSVISLSFTFLKRKQARIEQRGYRTVRSSFELLIVKRTGRVKISKHCHLFLWPYQR